MPSSRRVSFFFLKAWLARLKQGITGRRFDFSCATSELAGGNSRSSSTLTSSSLTHSGPKCFGCSMLFGFMFITPRLRTRPFTAFPFGAACGEATADCAAICGEPFWRANTGHHGACVQLASHCSLSLTAPIDPEPLLFPLPLPPFPPFPSAMG